MIAYDVDIPDWDAFVEQVSGCGGFFNDPRTRDFVYYEDQENGETKTFR